MRNDCDEFADKRWKFTRQSTPLRLEECSNKKGMVSDLSTTDLSGSIACCDTKLSCEQ